MTTIELYRTFNSWDFDYFHPVEAETGYPSDYAIVPVVRTRNMLGTRWGDVDNHAIDTIMDNVEDGPTEALMKHFERRGWHAIRGLWWTQSEWMVYVVAAETEEYAAAVQADYDAWLAGDVWKAHDTEEDCWTFFPHTEDDTDALKQYTRERMGLPEDTTVKVFEPYTTTAFREVN